jgi:hypothetical protein
VRPPVRPATRGMRVGSMASASVISGRIVVRRRASLDVPAPGGPSRRMLWSEHLHIFQLCSRSFGHRLSALRALFREAAWG